MRHRSVIVASVAAFVVGAAWYSPLLFGEAYGRLRGIDPASPSEGAPIALLGELARVLVVAYAIAHFVARLGVVDWRGGVRLGLRAWAGFQAMLLLGAVLHEDMAWALYGIHAGDALVKTTLMGAVLGAWQPKRKESTPAGAARPAA